jgi:hypothetical protein
MGWSILTVVVTLIFLRMIWPRSVERQALEAAAEIAVRLFEDDSNWSRNRDGSASIWRHESAPVMIRHKHPIYQLIREPRWRDWSAETSGQKLPLSYLHFIRLTRVVRSGRVDETMARVDALADAVTKIARKRQDPRP